MQLVFGKSRTVNNAPAFFTNQVMRMEFYDFSILHKDY